MQGPAVKPPLIIAGGGLAGGLAALALSEKRPEVDFMLVEAGPGFGGNHTWSWFDSDIGAAGGWLAGLLSAKHWPGHDIRFPRRRRRLDGGYNSLAAERLDALLKARFAPQRYRLGEAIVALGADFVQLESGERIAASAVIDARGPDRFDMPDLAWQKFLGLTCRFDKPHGVERPTVMDAEVDQSFGYRFVYTLPFSQREMLIEDTYYATDPAVDVPRLRRHIADYAATAGWGDFEAIGEEIGIGRVVPQGPLRLARAERIEDQHAEAHGGGEVDRAPEQAFGSLMQITVGTGINRAAGKIVRTCIGKPDLYLVALRRDRNEGHIALLSI